MEKGGTLVPRSTHFQGLEEKAKRREVVPAAKLFGTDPFHAVLTRGLLKSQVLSASSELQVLPHLHHSCPAPLKDPTKLIFIDLKSGVTWYVS